MRTVAGISKYIAKHLGEEFATVFDVQMDEVMYYTRAMALDDMETGLAEIKDKLQALAQAVVMEVAHSYLREHHGSDFGEPDINVDWNCVYDKNMNVIEPIAKLTEKQHVIVNIVTRNLMSTFRKGRQLAYKIIIRRDEYLKTKVDDAALVGPDFSPVRTRGRDYKKNPPMERIEVEIMRLERKLPNLSLDEGRRLSMLYKETRAPLA